MTQGRDVTAMLPYLSRYMGHATIDSTYCYIHTSPEFIDGYAQITQKSQCRYCRRSYSNETQSENRCPQLELC